MVFHWQWHYGTKEAIIHKAIPMNMGNLQGGLKLFGFHPPPLRLSSNAEVFAETHLHSPLESIDQDHQQLRSGPLFGPKLHHLFEWVFGLFDDSKRSDVPFGHAPFPQLTQQQRQAGHSLDLHAFHTESFGSRCHETIARLSANRVERHEHNSPEIRNTRLRTSIGRREAEIGREGDSKAIVD